MTTNSIDPSARALIAESHHPSAHALRSYLERIGLIADVAADAVDALALIQKQAYFIVFLNSRLPDAPGSEVVIQIRASEQNASVPIVAISPDDRPGTRQEMLASGCQEFLLMPIDLTHVGALLDRWGVLPDRSAGNT